jgi:glycogen debranching enzyme
VWPVISWLMWWSLERAGEHEHAAQLRGEALDQLASGGLAEYFEPRTGEPLGSDDQSWTAAVTLDWLACD